MLNTQKTRITAVYGTEREGSTYHIVQQFLEHFPEAEVTEFVLPRDLPHFCVGCMSCITHQESKCPHSQYTLPVLEAMEQADLIILASPVYVFHASGQMKAFLDHFPYLWMVHRPMAAMFQKTGLAVSTAAGGGMKSANKDMKDSMDFWGVGRVFTYGKAVAAADWDGVSEENRCKIRQDTDRIAQKLKRSMAQRKTGIKAKILFYVMRMMQKKFVVNEADRTYWTERGWLGAGRPWK